MKYIEKSLAVTLVITFLLQLVPITVFAATVTSTDSKEEDTIVEEIENLREPDKKYFKMSDGSTLVAMYNTNIHNYYDGKYRDINNNLIGITDLYNNNLKIKFANKSNNKLVSIKFGSDKVSWYLENSNKVKVERQNEDIEDNIDNKLKLKNTSSVIYRDILKNIDIEYVNISNTLKENIIIKDKEYSKIVFVFDTKLNMKVNSDNSVSIGEYLIDAPYMYDANMNYSENVKLNLTKEKNYYKLEIIPDEKFMENSVYPVTIDPSINTSQHYSLIKDTFVYPADASSNVSNRGNQASLVIGSSNESMVGKTYGRGLIKFTLPSLKTGDQIIDASLYLTSTPMHWYGTYPTSQIEFDVHKMNVNWDTYTAYYSNTNNYDNKVTDYIVYEYSTSNPMKTYEFNITEIVKDWYVTGKNYGVMIKEKNEVANLNRRAAYFFSSDCLAQYASNRPYSTINYRNQTGIESYMSYTNYDTLNNSVMVNNYNGNLVLIHNDITSLSNVLSSSIRHVYNTNDKDTNIGYGNGYRLNYSEEIEITTIGSNTYAKYIDSDSTKKYFIYSNNTYIYEDGTDLKLTLNNGKFILEDKIGNKKEFTKYGNVYKLTKVIDTNSNSININYTNGYISSIVDATNNMVTFTYTNNLLSKISNSVEEINYTYVDNNLVTITYDDNTFSTYTYTNNLLNTITDIDNYKLVFTYYDGYLYRLHKVEEYSSDNVIGIANTFEYLNYATKISDNKTSVIYAFDNYGRTINITSSDGNTRYGKTYTYGDDNSNKNKLIYTDDLTKPVKNILKNHGFEITGSWEEVKASQGSCTIIESLSSTGSKALKCITTTGNVEYRQSVNLLKDKTYTLSFKAKNISNGRVKIYYINENNEEVIIKELSNIENEWKRYYFIFTPNADISNYYVSLGIENTGEAYFDEIQLEESSAPSLYNIIENSSFDYNGSWTKSSSMDSNDKITTIDDNKSFKVNGIYNKKKILSQTHYIKGKKGDVYKAQLYIKSSGIPGYNSNTSRSAVTVGIYNTDGTYSWSTIDLISQTNEWQYYSYSFKTEKDYDYIIFNLRFYNNANEIYYDDINLFRDSNSNSYIYDTNGNLINAKSLSDENQYTYDLKNQLISVNKNNNNYSYVYDENYKNRVIKSSNSYLDYFYNYNSYGSIINSKIKEKDNDDSKYIEVSNEYDANGNLIKQIDELDSETNYTYTQKGYINTITNPKNKIINYNYENNKLSSISSGNRLNTYTYENNNLKTINYNGITYEFNYDGYGNNISTKINNNVILTNEYESNNGNLIKKTYGNGKTINYTYDNFSRLVSTSDLVYYEYDNLGNLGIIRNKKTNTETNYIYDFSNRLIELRQNDNYSINYTYNNDAVLSNIKYKLNDININYNYLYSLNNRINKININSNEIQYTYDNLSRLSNYKINDNYTVNYNYLDLMNNKTTTLLEKIITNNNTFIYTYDNLGNITNIKRNNIETNKYYYNEFSELIKEDDLVNNITIEYIYDNGGNILSKKYYEYNTNNLLNEINYLYSSNRSYLLVNYNGINITYDAIGNPLQINDRVLNWEGRTLSRVDNNTYIYNEDGVRISKKVGNVETKYYLEGSKIIFEETNGNMLYYIYDYSGDVIGFNYQGNDYYYEKNITNDVIGIMDSNYNIIVNYEYDSYGKLLSIKDNNGNVITDANNIGIKNPIRYRSYYYDNETGYYYLNARYYDPELSRFINADNILGANGDMNSYNIYAYCSNNPINYSDPSGNASIWSFIKTIFSSVPAYAGTVTGVGAIDGPSPIFDIAGLGVALGIGIYQAINTASTETMKKDKISELGEFSRKPCTTAKIINAKVIRGKRLTIDDATKIFLKREDIMCDTRIDAQFVALKTNRKYYEHRKHKPLPNYYQHFHVQGYKHIHIWYIE